jgi:hypothetical protein
MFCVAVRVLADTKTVMAESEKFLQDMLKKRSPTMRQEPRKQPDFYVVSPDGFKQGPFDITTAQKMVDTNNYALDQKWKGHFYESATGRFDPLFGRMQPTRYQYPRWVMERA